eukprot:superscaffoldBa00009043_g23818
MEKKKQENKMRRDQLNDEYLELLDKQRLYFKTVKDFKEIGRVPSDTDRRRYHESHDESVKETSRVSPDGHTVISRVTMGTRGSSDGLIREGLKQQLLYCRVSIGFHLQILPGGAVGGVHKPTDYCWLKVFAMKHGVVGIRGVKSGLYLCMSAEGLASGTEKFTDDCLFKENLEENHYTTYSSLTHPGLFLALSHKGEVRKGNSVGRHQSCTHFLPRRTP